MFGTVAISCEANGQTFEAQAGCIGEPASALLREPIRLDRKILARCEKPNVFRPLIGTLVRGPQLDALQSALADSFRLINVSGWLQLHTLVRRQRVRCLIVDPFHSDLSHTPELCRILGAYPELPVIVYFSPSPASFNALLHIPRIGKTEYLIQDFEDSPEAIVRIVKNIVRSEVKLRLKKLLRPRLRQLTPLLEQILNALIDTPERFLRSSQVAAESGLATACVYRALRRCRLQSPKRLVIACRAVDALLALKNPGMLVADVSGQLGYVHPRILSKHFQLVFGVSPSQSRRKIPAAAAVQRVFEFIQS